MNLSNACALLYDLTILLPMTITEEYFQPHEREKIISLMTYSEEEKKHIPGVQLCAK